VMHVYYIFFYYHFLRKSISQVFIQTAS
jgi:hypothetical protein